jgi:branched-chain amino acid transport system permease protein
MIFQFILSGLAIGSIYSLVALGLVMVIRAINVVNFAQGEMVMVGAYICFSFYTSLKMPLLACILISTGLTALVAIGMERLSIHYLQNPSIRNMVTSTVAMSIILKDAGRILFGSDIWPFPSFLGEKAIRILGLRFVPQSILILAISLTLMVVLHLFLQKTKTGLCIRALMVDREMGGLVGINFYTVTFLCFAISGILGAAAGILIMPIVFVSFNMGAIIYKGLVALVLGGMYSFPGAILGGLLLGITEIFIGGYVSTDYRDAIIYLGLIVILLFRPLGLLGQR